jgi:hypothetical protein
MFFLIEALRDYLRIEDEYRACQERAEREADYYCWKEGCARDAALMRVQQAFNELVDDRVQILLEMRLSNPNP